MPKHLRRSLIYAAKACSSVFLFIIATARTLKPPWLPWSLCTVLQRFCFNCSPRDGSGPSELLKIPVQYSPGGTLRSADAGLSLTPTQCLKSQGKLSFRCYTLCFEGRNRDIQQGLGGLHGSAFFNAFAGLPKAEIRVPPCTACSVPSAPALNTSARTSCVHGKTCCCACHEANSHVRDPICCACLQLHSQLSPTYTPEMRFALNLVPLAP